MNKLNRDLLKTHNLPADVKIGVQKEMPVKVMQYGEGGFLRAFVDIMIDDLNSNNLFNGAITVIQPIERGMIDMLNAQDGLYTVVLRGLEDGEPVAQKKIVTSITSATNPYSDFDTYFANAKNPDLRVIVSNTTEAGIAYDASDKLMDTPQKSFPGKLTAFLYERYKTFRADPAKGLIIIPCELIDENGTNLKKMVLRYANEWALSDEFISWLNNHNYFTNTLVDRIVTGYPRDEVDALNAELGYVDDLLDTGEIFHFWVIEAPENIALDALASELPFDKIGLNVVWTHDCTPYKARKVRILNGAHTKSVLAAYLTGKNTVGEMMGDANFRKYLELGLFEEIIPGILKYLPYDNLKAFADSVFDRFANPTIKHNLLSIALNSQSKYRARVLPSILDYINEKKELPKMLTFSFAALIAFYKGTQIKDGALIGTRAGAEYRIEDDMPVLEFFANAWSENGNDKAALAKKVCGNADFWGQDLNELPGFAQKVAEHLEEIQNIGMEAALNKIL